MSGIVVLISGHGSNLAAICNNANLLKQVKCVISNVTDAPGLNIGQKFSIPCYTVVHQQYPTREDFDKQLAQIIDQYAPQYVILAGFMRVLTSWFVKHYSMRLINIHPSILPAFIGTNAIEQAFRAQVKISGATVHFVTTELDNGPIIAQGVVATAPGKIAADLASKIHQLEHIIYPFSIHKLINNKVHHTSDGVIVEKESTDAALLGEFSGKIFY